ncbi:hypothetical protein [Moorena sp. SIOASIH]|nr:hypothetical protein [Moorena sp. SIOASIH]
MHYLFNSFIVLSKGTVSRGDKHGLLFLIPSIVVDSFWSAQGT